MSNFKRKVNIVESTTPPTNMYDWWYDLNVNVLKRYYGGSWAPVASSKELKKAVFSPFDIPDDEIWIIAPGAEKLEFPDEIYDENEDPVTLYGYYEFLLRSWTPYDENGETSDWSVFYDADRSLYRLKAPKSQIKSLSSGMLPSMPQVDSVVIILPQSCIDITQAAIDLTLHDITDDEGGRHGTQITNVHILITASSTIQIAGEAFQFYQDPEFGVSNVYFYIYSKEYPDHITTEDGGDLYPIITVVEGSCNLYVYVQHYLVDRYETEAPDYWENATIKKLS